MAELMAETLVIIFDVLAPATKFEVHQSPNATNFQLMTRNAGSPLSPLTTGEYHETYCAVFGWLLSGKTIRTELGENSARSPICSVLFWLVNTVGRPALTIAFAVILFPSDMISRLLAVGPRTVPAVPVSRIFTGVIPEGTSEDSLTTSRSVPETFTCPETFMATVVLSFLTK